MEVMLARSTNGKTLGGRNVEVNDVSAMVAPEPPVPPEGLGERGTLEWRKVWQAGRWFWSDQDYHWIEQLARAYDDVAEFRAEIKRMGLTVEGYNGQTVANPLIAEVRRAEDTIRKCLSQLGFSPTDRARLKLTELKGASELQKLVNNGGNGPTNAETAYEYAEGEW
jgi:P27 family predicted phage terminase small subunit